MTAYFQGRRKCQQKLTHFSLNVKSVNKLSTEKWRMTPFGITFESTIGALDD